jgi:hypothetical protein
MIANRYRLIVALAVGLTAAGAARAQDSKSKDDAIDSLLEKLAAPSGESANGKATAKPAEKAKAQKPEAGRPSQGSKDGAGSKSSAGQTGKKASAGQTAKPSKPKSPGAGAVAPKDQAIDDLLEKLGEHKDTPTPEEHPRMPAGGQEPKDQPPTGKAGAPKLAGKDKEIDERLEELAGRRRRRRPADDEQRSGPVGEIIKEMRDVEQRLGKPDPSEDTQNKQKQIVKRIQTLIDEVSKSGSSAGRLVMRRNRRPGQQPGQEQGEREGAMAQGAPPMKPLKPSSQHSTAGGRDVWGHLPPELRQIMENSFKETELSTKSEMIRRYFLSVAKGKPIREE